MSDNTYALAGFDSGIGAWILHHRPFQRWQSDGDFRALMARDFPAVEVDKTDLYWFCLDDTGQPLGVEVAPRA